MIERLVHAVDQKTDSIWLTIYADMITNLMLVFLALYSLELMGQDALLKALQSMKILEAEKIEKIDPNFKITDFSSVAVLLHARLDNEVGLSLIEEAGAIRIELGEGILFGSGQAQTKLSAEDVLLKVATTLKQLPFTVIVEGHTDDVPLNNHAHFKNNRELSLARAMSLIHWFEKKGGISPAQFAAASYGEFKPRSSNITDNGRRMNRRVEIVLMKDFPYEPKQDL